MSPDQYKSHPFVKRLVHTSNSFTAALPNIAKYLIVNESECRGLTLFVGDTADWVVGLRSYDEDGAPTVCWSSGEDCLMALINLDKSVGEGNFHPDKKELARMAKAALKSKT